MKHLIITVLVVLAPFAASAKRPSGKGPSHGVRVAEEFMRVGLKDPEGAQFTYINESKPCDGSTFVSGLMNAKNSYGAFTGPKPFLMRVTGNIGATISLEGYTLGKPEDVAAYNACEPPPNLLSEH